VDQKLNIIMEKGKLSFGAYLPDYPGLVAVGKTWKECWNNLGKSLLLHLEEERYGKTKSKS